MIADPQTRLEDLTETLRLLRESVEVLKNSDGDTVALANKLAGARAEIEITENRKNKVLAELRDLRAAEIDKELRDLRIEDERIGTLLADHAHEVMDIMSEWFGKGPAKLLRHPGMSHTALDVASNDRTRRTVLEQRLQPEREALWKKSAALRREMENLNVPKSEPEPVAV